MKKLKFRFILYFECNNIIKINLWVLSVPWFILQHLRLIYTFQEELNLQGNLATLVLMNQSFVAKMPLIPDFLDKLFSAHIILPHSIQPSQDFYLNLSCISCDVFGLLILFLCSPLKWKPACAIDMLTAGSREAYGKPWELFWRKVFHLRELKLWKLNCVANIFASRCLSHLLCYTYYLCLVLDSAIGFLATKCVYETQNHLHSFSWGWQGSYLDLWSTVALYSSSSIGSLSETVFSLQCDFFFSFFPCHLVFH